MTLQTREPGDTGTVSARISPLVSRRNILTSTASAVALVPVAALGEPVPPAAHDAEVVSPPERVSLNMTINGRSRSLAIDPRTTLLDALRENLGLTGAQKGCDHGQCGACTVLIGGTRVLSCLT